MDQLPSLDALLSKLSEIGASDVHLKVGSPPAYRIDGQLHFSELPKVRPDDTRQWAEELLDEKNSAIFENDGEADFGYGTPTLGRFRVNIYRQRGSIALVVRAVVSGSKGFVELGLPEAVGRVCREDRGLVIVTGPSGSGKTTSLNAMLDEINSNRRVSVVTLEDPIEMLHRDKMGIVSQREVGVDVVSFSEGLYRVLRQDPNVIMVSEMRDADTVEAALYAAETGHLVLTAMYTNDATETITRLVEVFEPHRHHQIRLRIARNVKAIISQRLVSTADGAGRVPAVEVLTENDRMFDYVMDPELTPKLEEVMAEGAYYGMKTFDQGLLQMFRDGTISFEEALNNASNPTDFRMAAQKTGLRTA
ncbi:MAG: PilT/PilU family type 4a pilus ATPase [Acidimicrobiia bacterium]|nr:PilT/PilU family type 4a pilus ATPase [Acidimicrobiia bacterium]